MNIELSGGGAVTDDHRELKENGQQSRRTFVISPMKSMSAMISSAM